MKRLALLVGMVVIAMAMAAPAYAVDTVRDGYGGNGADVLDVVDNSGGNGGEGEVAAGAPQQPQQVVASDTSGSSGSLPFTGLDVGLLALGGVALLGLGLGLRRFARPLSS